ncbi:HAD-IC family P-type ATPase [Leucobacter sp. UCMA 4100]|uniref:HAD-IC family P-type ATPase n=1 Tax=Leucobacter sp. UCMA 4100 TaxID=2810534 RepID=UPI0022EAE4AE|nr:HAD-IC family P-type ATPase [Leucobacter sp. UCMA 4100]MDA3147488.1 HAD-IC family P-type ATPase [Leucobacter sp. UCMA 4100]
MHVSEPQQGTPAEPGDPSRSLTDAHPLTNDEVRDRVERGETNTIESKTSRSFGDIFRANVFTRVNIIYAVLFALVMGTGHFIDGLFGFIIIVNSTVGMVQEIRAKRTLDRLALLGKSPARVERADGVQEIAPEEIVLGDIVLLAAGDQIPVDGTVIDEVGLELDESLLTGESDAVQGHPGFAVLSGSFVAAGSGRFVTTAVGANAYATKLTNEASVFKKPASQLREGIDQILKYITWILVPVGALSIWNQLAGGQEWRDAIRGLVAALVPMIPEGLVLMTSVAMAVGVIRLGKHQCLVQDLPAIEQLARVDIVCTDKTGTLTEDGMRVSRIETAADAPGTHSANDTVETVLSTIGAIEEKPNSSMAAILEHLGHIAPLEAAQQIAFSSARKWAGVELAAPVPLPAEGKNPEREGLSWFLGAPDILLPEGDAAHAHAAVLAEEGLRVLALVSAPASIEHEQLPQNITAEALVVLDQRLRAEAPGTIDFFTKQRVSLKVISGDNAAAVGAIAEQVGVPHGRDAVDARTLDPESESFGSEVAHHTTFGRVTPDQKRSIVHALQEEGHVVAMTGDGVNDVLALKDADVGVAMGSGSPAARAVSRIVLLDNSFATLPHVVAEGRRVIGNIERVATLFLTKTLYSALLALLVALIAVPYPFLPRHITLIAWFTIGIPSFFLALAPNAARAQDGFVRRVLSEAVPGGIGASLAAFGAYVTARQVFGVSDATRVMNSSTSFLALIIVAFFVLAMVARPFRLWKVGLVGTMIGCLLAIMITPLGSLVFDIELGDWRAILIALGFGVAGIATRSLIWRGMRRFVPPTR